MRADGAHTVYMSSVTSQEDGYDTIYAWVTYRFYTCCPLLLTILQCLTFHFLSTHSACQDCNIHRPCCVHLERSVTACYRHQVMCVCVTVVGGRGEREISIACILDGMERPSVVDYCQGDPIVMTAGPADQ